MKPRLLSIFLLTTVLVALPSLVGAKEVLKIGVTAGPHEEIMEVVQEILAVDDIELQIVTFSDYVTPNLVLADGDLDANSFQHIPYLDQFSKDRNLELTWIARTVIFPMGVYSDRYKSLDEVKVNDTVAIPNDPTNGGRALLLLESAGLIKLDENAGIKATVFDIISNPKKLKILELDAANLPRALDDVELAAINTNYALEAGINPVRDSLFIEQPDSPYVNVIATRTAELDSPVLKKLVTAYQSQKVQNFVNKRFEGSVIVCFDLTD